MAFRHQVRMNTIRTATRITEYSPSPKNIAEAMNTGWRRMRLKQLRIPTMGTCSTTTTTPANSLCTATVPTLTLTGCSNTLKNKLKMSPSSSSFPISNRTTRTTTNVTKGLKGSKEYWANYEIPGDLAGLPGGLGGKFS